jgi:Reverse transcriptase (RNA-dependent DNA polymerase)/GAG-pre-integrase domain
MSYVTKSLFSTGYSLLLFIISTYMFVQTIIETGKQVPSYLHSISADANFRGYLSDPLACIILTRLDFAEIDSFHSHWMSFVVYAIACLGPQHATASILLTVFGLFFDCLMAAFLSTEVGSGLGLLFNLAHLLYEWGSQPTHPPPYVPKRLRGWKPLRTRIKTMVRVVSWVNISTVAKSVANKGAHCVSAFATAVKQVINQEHASITQSAWSQPDQDDDDDDYPPDDGPYATAVSKCRSSHESLLHIEEHRAIAKARTSLWQQLLTFMQCLKGGNFSAAKLIVLSMVILKSATSTVAPCDHYYDSDSFLIAIDNCSSRCITNCMADYVEPPVRVKVKVNGIGGAVIATHKGTVKWAIEDDHGRRHTWLIPDTYFHESTPYRLLSPQHWAQTQHDGRGTWAATYQDAVELFWKGNRFSRSIPLSGSSNIALLRSAPGFTKMHAFCVEISTIKSDSFIDELLVLPTVAVTDDEESGSESEDEGFLDEAPAVRRHPDLPDEAFDEPKRAEQFQKEMTAAFDSGSNISKIQQRQIVEDDPVQFDNPQAELLSWHYRLGHLPFGRIKKLAARGDLPSYLLQAKVPRCASCLFGKATRRPWRTKAPVNQQQVPPATVPGAVVGVDQLISSTPGFVGQMRGALTRRRYTVSTIFVDHFSGLSFVHLQLSTAATHTLEAKKAFERFAKQHGVTVRHYHADNHIFDSKAFVAEVEQCGQSISYCAVNAHHQNGRAEKKIRDLQELARTMLLHARQRWPNAITANLWPFALRMANDLSNLAPILKQGEHVSPIELFSQVDVKPQVKFTHTFGSPVYVLDADIQAGKQKPKWEYKSRIGIYVGASPRHSKKVALVLNLLTGHVSPQFHCQFDDMCDTLRPSAGNPLPQSKWQERAGFVGKVDASRAAAEPLRDGFYEPGHPVAERGDPQQVNDQTRFDIDEQQHPMLADDVDVPEDAVAPPNVMPPQEAAPQVVTRSGGTVRRPERFSENFQSYFVPWEVFHDDAYDLQDKMDDPIAFAASNNPDIMYLNEAMAAPDKDEFRKAMLREVESHVKNKHWELVKRADLPAGTEVLPAVWAFRRKRRISTQEVYKWKARLNLHGGRQTKNVNYWETYSPVVGWSTIRMFLILMLINGWSSKQVDFVLAFPQADIECEMYMEVPQGFNVDGVRADYCLRLQKNLYGQKQAGRVWNQYLHDGLIARGFVQSSVDMCVYYRKSVVLMVYVDDGIFIGRNQRDIDEAYGLLIKPFTDKKGVTHRAYVMTDEGTLADYLGVNIDRLPNGLIKLTQPHLIQQILKDLGMDGATKPQPTPAAPSVKLHRDPGGKAATDEWHYRSVVGKMNFLEKSTRVDIAYSVHQCARFAADPKESHAAALKRIGRYLVGTQDKGLILNPRSHSFECYVDADFVGNWDRVNADVDPSTAKSRTGYVIMYGGCPMVWASKLQREVALSTTEAEYNALSESLREVISTMQLLKETKEKLHWVTTNQPPEVHCKVFEDNSGALEMSRLPKMRPRTKHICVRMHHFREHVRKGLISLHKIPTRYQLADIATKPQPVKLFVEQRESLMQWQAETATKDELRQQATLLRACDVSGHVSGTLASVSEALSVSQSQL